ncbi:MAG: rhamnulokinase family protein [Planctomycetaceae bacterium]
MSEQCRLAVDLGAESGRVIAGLFDGRAMRLEEVHRFPNGPVRLAGTLRWDALRLWGEIRTGLAKAVAVYGNRIASVGVDSWGVDGVLFSKHFEMLGQPWHYRDDRTRGLIDAACNRVPRREIFAATGVQFLEINTLYQLLALKRDAPELLDAAERFLMMPDFFHWCLSGSQAGEFTNATTTQCLDPRSRDWAGDLLRRFELPAKIFPQLVQPGTKLGRIREEVAREAGLPRIEVIAPATHDTASAVAAVPVDSTSSGSATGTPDWAYVSSGTWSLIGVEIARPVLTDRALEFNLTNEGGVDDTFRLLKNVMGLWLVQQCKRSFERNGNDFDYAELARLAERAAPFHSLIDPDDGRFLNPDDMPRAIASFCEETGQPSPANPGEFVRCALESLALKYRVVLGRIEELTDVPVRTIHVVGGGARNALLNRFTASACGRPVVAGPVEATALGNVLVQSRAAGEIGSLSELRAVVRASCVLDRYEPENETAWRDAGGRFAALLARHAG